MKTAVIIDSLDDQQKARAILDQADCAAPFGLVAEAGVDEEVLAGVNFRRLKLYLPEDIAENLDEESWRISNHWPEILGIKKTASFLYFDEIYWPTIIRAAVHRRLLKAIVYSLSLEKFIKAETPERLVVSDGSAELVFAAKAMAEKHGLEFVGIPEPGSRRRPGLRPRMIELFDRLQQLRFDLGRRKIYQGLYGADKILIVEESQFYSLEEKLPDGVKLLLISPNRVRPLRDKDNSTFVLRLPHIGRRKANRETDIILAQLKSVIVGAPIRIELLDGLGFGPIFETSLIDSVIENLPLVISASRVISEIISSSGGGTSAFYNDIMPVQRAMITASRKAGAPTTLIQHGYACRIESPPGYLSKFTDNVAVWGESGSAFYQKVGWDEKNVGIVGCEKLEQYPDISRRKNRSEIISGHGLDRTKPVVLWATHPPDFYYTAVNLGQEKMVEAFAAAVKKYPEINFVIKHHPTENSQGIDRRLVDLPVTILRRADAVALLSVCDLVLVYSSTVGLEAMALDKPVAVCNFSGRPEIATYAEDGAAARVDSIERLSQVIGEIVLEKKDPDSAGRKSFVEKYLSRTDRPANQRFVDFLISTMEDE